MILISSGISLYSQDESSANKIHLQQAFETSLGVVNLSPDLNDSLFPGLFYFYTIKGSTLFDIYYSFNQSMNIGVETGFGTIPIIGVLSYYNALCITFPFRIFYEYVIGPVGIMPFTGWSNNFLVADKTYYWGQLEYGCKLCVYSFYIMAAAEHSFLEESFLFFPDCIRVGIGYEFIRMF